VRFRPKRAITRVLRSITDPVKIKSLLLMLLCIWGCACAKFRRPAAPREVVLELKRLRLCVDVARAELISYWEIWHEHCYDCLATNPRCVVDVGANIGAFSLYQTMSQHAERVIAFEPSPEVFARLAKNLELNELTNVRAVNAAVGDKPGTLAFSQGLMSINDRIDESGTLRVRVVTLDDELRDVPSIDLLKIDTEGYEAKVLQGAPDTLKKTRHVVLEMHYPGEAEEIRAMMEPLGFSLSKVQGGLVFYQRK
jgi:FkbM family methyltransferase